MFSETQWKIISELSQRDKTPSELASLLKISLPSIHYQLKDLESRQLVKKTEKKDGKTRPFTSYSLGQGFIYLIEALPGEINRIFLKINENARIHLRIWSITQERYHPYLESFWWKLEDHLEEIEAVAVFGSVAKGEAKEGSDIDILFLVKDENKIEKYSRLFGVTEIGPKNSVEMVMAQIFTPELFQKSLNNKSKFATNILNDLKIIYDPKNLLRKMKDESLKKSK